MTRRKRRNHTASFKAKVALAAVRGEGFSGFGGAFCVPTLATGIETCTGAPSGTSLFVQVRDSSGLGDTFDLDVAVAPVTVLAFPGDLPAAGQTVAPRADALFEITGLTPGTAYSVSVAGGNDRTILFVSLDSEFGFGCFSILNTGAVSRCVIAAQGTSLFVRVEDFSGLGDTFSLDVVVVPVTVLAYPSDLPTVGQSVIPGGDALFEITGLEPNTSYSVTVAGVNNIDLWVRRGSALGVSVCVSASDAVSETCIAATLGTSLFVQVKDSSGLGDTFSLDVIETP